MQTEASNFYETVLRVAALPALAFVIWLSWMITNRLMSPEWQQKRRSQQIRKAQAERQALAEKLKAANEAAASAGVKKSSV